jgi:DNA-binding transcriptional ArsR family regulator/rhodanese-related sulfurtransferase
MSKTIEKAKERQDYLFEEMASLLDAVASPVRLKIIHFLTQAPHSVEQLSLKLGQSIANTSMHLKKMQREGILNTETLGQKRIYSLAQDEMKEFWEQIQNFALIHTPSNKIASKDIYLEELEWPKEIDETIQMIKARKVTLLDVRPDDEIDDVDSSYKKYVVHISSDNLKKLKEDLPKSRPILVICRGRLCVMSNESTYVLRKLGFDAYKLNLSWFQVSKKLMEG